ncbi:MAG: hypothetical protein DMG49_23320 [Acidobacteria bacterium]|nr:MAG: hypothetical protein DMG49_23320 [Acidobacteriota bacterium]
MACAGVNGRLSGWSLPWHSSRSRVPAQVAQAIAKEEAFKPAEKELAGVQKIAGCSLLNPISADAFTINDPPVML